MNETHPTSDSIRDIAYAFQPSRTLLSAYELGLFSVLGNDGQSSQKVAQSLGTAWRSTDRLMNALVAMGLLVKDKEIFRNSAASSKFLVATSPDYMSGLMHTVHLWDTWSTLTNAVRVGTSVRSEIPQKADRATWNEAFIAAMHYRAHKQASVVAAQMHVKDGSRVLDVGGGSGAFAVAFVRAGRGVKATIFDLPEVLPLTEKYVRAEGVLDRIEFVGGDYTKDELPTGYDLVYLSAIVHSNSADQNRRLIANCARALNPSGSVVVQDFIMNEERTEPEMGALFALNMLVGTAAGDTYTESEIRGWMKEAGLSDMSRVETPFGASQIWGGRPA